MQKAIVFKASSLGIGLAALGAATFAACGTTDSNDIIDAGEEPAIEAGPDDVNVKDVARDRHMDTDAGSPDVTDASAGGHDADADARLDAAKEADVLVLPETGTPCSPSNAIQTQKCGFCGTQERVCRDFIDSGTPVWQDWGFCQNSVDGGCQPGDTMDASCGNCGHMSLTCQSSCTWPTTGTCKDAGPCAPDDLDYKPGLSCDAGGRTRVCQNTCEWGDFSLECMGEPLRTLIVPASEGATSAIKVTMTPKPQIGRLDVDDCPVSGISSVMTSFNYAVLENDNDQDARVSIWHSYAPTSDFTDTIMAVYDTAERPGDSDNAARMACMAGTTVDDYCTGTNDPSMCPDNLAGLTDDEGSLPGNTIVIPAHSHVIVYSAMWSSSDSGDVMLNVLVNTLSP